MARSMGEVSRRMWAWAAALLCVAALDRPAAAQGAAASPALDRCIARIDAVREHALKTGERTAQAADMALVIDELRAMAREHDHRGEVELAIACRFRAAVARQFEGSDDAALEELPAIVLEAADAGAKEIEVRALELEARLYFYQHNDLVRARELIDRAVRIERELAPSGGVPEAPMLEVLLLPANYGILLTARGVPRVGAVSPPQEGDAGAAWLLWEGKGSLTFLLASPGGPRLATVKTEIERLDIVGYDGLASLRERSRAAVGAEVGESAERAVSAGPITMERGPASTPWQRLARISGIAATPAMQRVPLSAAGVAGDLYLVDTSGGPPQRLTSTGGLSSPIFVRGDLEVLALRGDEVMRVRLAGGQPQAMTALPGVRRLIGVDPDSPDGVICLGGPEGADTLYALDLASMRANPIGQVTDPAEIAYLLGDDRDYGHTRLIVAAQNSAIAQWTVAQIQRADGPAQALTPGEGPSARQPALSGDNRFVVYVQLPSR